MDENLTCIFLGIINIIGKACAIVLTVVMTLVMLW